MLVIKEEAQQLVRAERECILKRFYWRNGGHFYVYQSSVPDAVHPNEEHGHDNATRYDIIHHTTCFKRLSGNTLIVEQLFQVDFRDVNTKQLLADYLEVIKAQIANTHDNWLIKV